MASPSLSDAAFLSDTAAQAYTIHTYSSLKRCGNWEPNRNGRRAARRQHDDFRADSGDLLRSAALAAHGIVMLPTSIVGDDLLRPDLVPLIPDLRAPRGNAMIF